MAHAWDAGCHDLAPEPQAEKAVVAVMRRLAGLGGAVVVAVQALQL